MIHEYTARSAIGPEISTINTATLAELDTEARFKPLPINLSSAEIRALVLDLIG